MQRFARWMMKRLGWRVTGELPAESHFVVIAAPHTSNWDLFYLLGAATALGMRVSWIGKHTLFVGPLGPFFRAIGGIPIDRRRSQKMVEQMVDQFETRDRLNLAIPPEGTSGRSEYWKSGFYWMAYKAQVPVSLGFLDYRKKEGGLGPLVYLTGNVRQDMDEIRAFYENVSGLRPENYGPIRFRDEPAD